MSQHRDETHLAREVRVVADLEEWSRAEIYTVRLEGGRTNAARAIAAAAAEETYRLTDQLPECSNGTSSIWRGNLEHVWEFLAGCRSQHYTLSRVIADYLVSPDNHVEGQDGPDEFDRPQTVAAYSAALCVVTWGVDFAVTAVGRIFEAIDLKYDGDFESEDRWSEVKRETEFVRRVVSAVVRAEQEDGRGFGPELLGVIRP